MDFRTKVEQLVHEFLETRQDLYLVELKISASSDITVILDGDESLTLQDCLDASRAIEFNLDREEHDFSLQVMSPGLSEPLKFPRQYKKNLGREVDLLLNNDEKVEGEITAVDEEKVTLTLRYRRPKLIGKGKEDVVEEREIPYTDIKKALIIIKF
ncbi:ribosome maturation factor RimP [Cloacibacterium rupense]|uniref:Ribosome maturation factor RimP n=1 Tax=Cloacibacterium rupense TaxID=517423 RepID=A0ABQ2NJA6_9FLAO|nr:ribosome assembly cofactor RimP [Cloacibacterium rupense]GGP03052.1 ribosome maturation factor RimP [Cloacibacterium rupense]